MPTVDPQHRREIKALQPNICLRCTHNSYDVNRLKHCRLCGSPLKIPAGWELSGENIYGYQGK